MTWTVRRRCEVLCLIAAMVVAFAIGVALPARPLFLPAGVVVVTR